MDKKLYEAYAKKSVSQMRAWQYYSGDANPPWLNARLRKYFNKNPHYRAPWIPVIVDSVTDRLLIDGFTVAQNPDAENALNALWDQGGLEQMAAQVHQDVVVTGEGFVLVERVGDVVIASRQEPASVAVMYEDPADQKRITSAAKFYTEGEYRKCVTYTDEKISYYTGPKVSAPTVLAESYMLSEEVDNKYGRIPWFHFCRSDRVIEPDFYPVIPIQDTINKFSILLGIATENNACSVRYIIGGDDADLPELLPGDTIGLPEGTSIGQLTSGDIEKYIQAIDNLTLAMASITRTPRHFFGATSQVPSGEALQAMEAPLISKVRGYHSKIGPTWCDVMAYLATENGVPVDRKSISVSWKDPRTTLLKSQAETRKTNVDAGIPLLNQLRDEGWRDKELTQLLNDRALEQGYKADDLLLADIREKAAERVATDLRPLVTEAMELITNTVLSQIATSQVFNQIVTAAKGE